MADVHCRGAGLGGVGVETDAGGGGRRVGKERSPREVGLGAQYSGSTRRYRSYR